MSYELKFHPKALKTWRKLGATIREQFKDKLKERLKNPRNLKDQLHGHKDLYKIKLRTAGYRLVYHVDDGKVVVMVVAIGKREKNQVYLQIE
ncbi:type II toxin-antitoxin system RelE family toxin [Microbulbifer sp.]|uniref:type II toxin-antitoxin system RelE family toxin n=1 Tax=Microbulbifer sp. TaxID=1908541 RepID=UPI003F2DE1C0